MNADVCIIGSGVAGAISAYKLASEGKTVIILESGPRFDYPDMELYSSLQRGLDPWNWYDPEKDLYEELSQPVVDLNRNRIKAVGGSTLHWASYTPRLQPKDFKIKTLFGIAADWPITYDELEPWYSLAEHEIGVSGGDGPGQPPRSSGYPMPEHPLSFGEREMMVPAFNALGISIGPEPIAITSKPYDNRPSCSVFSTCSPMCPIHAKYTGLVHVWKAEKTGKVIVNSHCHVRRIKLSGKRKVGSVEYVNQHGQSEKIYAKYFILAAGAVEIPRLLLLSEKSYNSKEGLANSSGQVGRNFLSQPRTEVHAELPKHVGPHRIGYITSLSWALYTHETLPEFGNVILRPSTYEGPDPALISLNSDLWGVDLFNIVRKKYGHHAHIIIEGDMLPKEENRVFLSSNLKDKFGDPAPAIEMKLGDYEFKGLDRGVKTCTDIMKHLKSSNIIRKGTAITGNHLIGTTRMGINQNESVCDMWGRCHDLDNLFIASSSLFPFAGCSNPTLTISALALRTADYLSKNI